MALLGWVFACPGIVRADAIIVTKAMTASTIAEIFIDENVIRVELEIGLRDIEAFRNVLPDDLYERLDHTPKRFVERLVRFFTEDWVIRLDAGDPLWGRIEEMEGGRRIKRDEITGKALPVQPKDAETVVRLIISYAFESQPATVSFTPPSSDGFARANIGFVVYHRMLPVTDFRYLGTEEHLDLDWEDPWYSCFRNRNLRRQFDSPLSAFLYVEPFEVRKEIVVRPKDLQYWVDLGLDGKEVIPAADQDALKKRVTEFLLKRCPVEIDGVRTEPILDRIHFIRRTLRQTRVIDPPEDLDVMSATLGVIFVYRTPKLPNRVEMEWDLFSPRIDALPTAATDEAGSLPSTLTPEDPVLVWQNFLTNPTIPVVRRVAKPMEAHINVPMISGGCALATIALITAGIRRKGPGRILSRRFILANVLLVFLAVTFFPYARLSVMNPFGARLLMTQADASAVLGALLHNIYRAFDSREEAVIYDRLAESISGDLLTDVYLQTLRSMELEGQGGARAKVDDVEILELVDGRINGDDAQEFRCRWNVCGSVGHWGHVHRRANQYDATLEITPVNGAWKITKIDLLDEKRLDSNTRS